MILSDQKKKGCASCLGGRIRQYRGRFCDQSGQLRVVLGAEPDMDEPGKVQYGVSTGIQAFKMEDLCFLTQEFSVCDRTWLELSFSGFENRKSLL